MASCMDIEPGMVFYLPFCKLHGRIGERRRKYAIVVRVNPTVLTFVVSSRLPEFVRAREALQQSYVQLHSDDYEYLERDSWVDCTDWKSEYSEDGIHAKLCEGEGQYVGCLIREDLQRILGAVERSKVLEPRIKKSISRSLNKIINN